MADPSNVSVSDNMPASSISRTEVVSKPCTLSRWRYWSIADSPSTLVPGLSCSRRQARAFLRLSASVSRHCSSPLKNSSHRARICLDFPES